MNAKMAPLVLRQRLEERSEWPFWHLHEPTVAVVQLDPGANRLRELLPSSWKCLLRIRELLDARACLAPSARSVERFKRLQQELEKEVISELEAGAFSEEAAGRSDSARELRQAAGYLTAHLRTGTWGATTIAPPGRNKLWIYCGPAHYWEASRVQTGLNLVVAEHRQDAQAVLDRVDDAASEACAVMSGWLNEPCDFDSEAPGLFACDLLLSAGEHARGHKNFAHFLPGDTPDIRCLGPDFSIVFPNVHRERLSRCSLPLLRAVIGGVGEGDAWYSDESAEVNEVLDASLAWFRGHDRGHFLRVLGAPAAGGAALADSFTRGAVEECVADLVGLASASCCTDPHLVAVAFAAEWARYLCRREEDFADSVAALILAGSMTAGADICDAGQIALGTPFETAGTLLKILLRSLRGDPEAWSAVVNAFRGGQRFKNLLGAKVARLPTDLDWVFTAA